MKVPYSVQEKGPGQWIAWVWYANTVGSGGTQQEAVEDLTQRIRQSIMRSKTTLGEFEL